MFCSLCRSEHDDCFIDKYADDTVVSGLIINDQGLNYKEEINSFVDWCDRNHLDLNVSMTKEKVIDFREQENDPEAIIIKEKEVERVETFKYLNVVLDKELT